jgi:leucyl/phenylalanyl-tRNA--protein transferase
MRHCAAPRDGQHGTWIDNAMLQAYTALHRLGWAHSIEVRDEQDALVGGLYGVAIGAAFFGESMFSRRRDASKVALLALARYMLENGGELIDCQVDNPHLNSLGARALPRVDFEQRLAQTVDKPGMPLPWILPENCGALL